MEIVHPIAMTVLNGALQGTRSCQLHRHCHRLRSERHRGGNRRCWCARRFAGNLRAEGCLAFWCAGRTQLHTGIAQLRHLRQLVSTPQFILDSRQKLAAQSSFGGAKIGPIVSNFLLRPITKKHAIAQNRRHLLPWLSGTASMLMLVRAEG